MPMNQYRQIGANKSTVFRSRSYSILVARGREGKGEGTGAEQRTGRVTRRAHFTVVKRHNRGSNLYVLPYRGTAWKDY